MSKKDSFYDEYYDIAQLLKQKRLNKKMSKKKAATALRLPVETITKLESLTERDLPESNAFGLYVRYAKFLGVDKKTVENSVAEVETKVKRRTLRRRPPKKSTKRNIVVSKTAAFALVAVIVVALVGYASWQLYILVDAPSVSVNYPPDNARVTDSKLVIEGEAATDATVLINGEPVASSEQGKFSLPIYLQPGYNEITITAVNNFSRERTISRTVFFERN